MTRRPKPPADFDDNPPLTAAQLRKARPAREVVPHIVAAAARGVVGRPKSDSPKVAISMRLDADVVTGLRDLGPGWQTKANKVLGAFVARKDAASYAEKITRDAKTGRFVHASPPERKAGRRSA